MGIFDHNGGPHYGQGAGMLLGLAVGDALGAYLEFSDAREPENYLREYQAGGPHNLPAGYWTDDTSMALAMADSLLMQEGKLDPKNMLACWRDWFRDGAYSSTDTCFDIGMTCQQAIQRFEEGVDPEECGTTGKWASGNGALMRMAPAVISAYRVEEAVELALGQTKLTHNNPEVLMYSEVFAKELWHGKPLPEYDHLRLPKDTPRQNVMSGGYVKESYQCAWWCVQNTDSFEEAVVTAVNRGHDADTSGAITGQLAGRIYGIHGEKAIPDWMYEGLYAHEHLYNLACRLCDLSIRDSRDGWGADVPRIGLQDPVRPSSQQENG